MTFRLVLLLGLLFSALPCLAQQPHPAELVPPPAALPPVPAPNADKHHGRRVPMQVSVAGDSARKDLTLYVDQGLNPMLGPDDQGRGEGGYRPLCFVPCAFQLRNGRYTFAVAAGDTSQGADPRSLLKVTPRLDVRHGDELIVRYQRKRGVRAAGWIVLVSTLAAGIAIASTGQQDDSTGKIDRQPGRIAGGTILSAVGVLGGILMAVRADVVKGWVVHH